MTYNVFVIVSVLCTKRSDAIYHYIVIASVLCEEISTYVYRDCFVGQKAPSSQ